MKTIIFLYLIIGGYNSQSPMMTRYRMPDMKTCLLAVKNGKLTNPTSVAGDYENVATMFCATDKTERWYGSTWWTDKLKKVD